MGNGGRLPHGLTPRQPCHAGPAAACPSTQGKGPLPEDLVGVTLRRPLGIIFGERGSGGVVFVEELVTDGNAARDGTVQVGDVLVRCSATVLKSGKDVVSAAEGYGDRPYDNWEQLMFDCVSPPPRPPGGSLPEAAPRGAVPGATPSPRACPSPCGRRPGPPS